MARNKGTGNREQGTESAESPAVLEVASDIPLFARRDQRYGETEVKAGQVVGSIIDSRLSLRQLDKALSSGLLTTSAPTTPD